MWSERPLSLVRPGLSLSARTGLTPARLSLVFCSNGRFRSCCKGLRSAELTLPILSTTDSMWSDQPGAARSSGNSQHHQHVASGPHTPVESSFGQPVTLLPSQVLHMRPSGSHDATMDSAHYRIPTTARNAPPPPPPSPSSSSASRLHHQHVALSSSSSSSRKTTAGGRFDSPIDVDSLPSPPPQPAPKPAPPPSPSGTQPTLIGVLNTTALILYPDNYYLAPTVSLGETPKVAYAKGEVLMQDGQEWARVKLKVHMMRLSGS